MKAPLERGHFTEFFPSLAFLLSLAGRGILQMSRLLFGEAAFQRAPAGGEDILLGFPTVDLGAMASHLKQGPTTVASRSSDLKKDHYSLCGTNLAGDSLGVVWADAKGQSQLG